MSNVRHTTMGFALSGALLLAATMLPAETLAIVGARVYPMTNAGMTNAVMTGAGALENATIVIRAGRIVSVAAATPPPTEARVIDARGRIVTPGLMSGGTQLGLVEVGSIDDSADHTVTSGPLGAAFDVAYALNPNSTLLAQARADGLTRAVSFPGGSAGAPFAGTGLVLCLSEGTDLVDRRKVAMYASVGGMASASATVGGSRSAQWILLRNALDEARHYRSARKVSGPRDQLLNRLDIEALLPVVAGHIPLVIAAERESDIRQAIQLAEDYELRVIISGGAEAWRAADALTAAGIPVVIDPTANLPWTFDQIGARADNAAILHQAGVTIAFAVPGLHMSYDAGAVIREAAGLAVANGLPYQAALAAVTVNPAVIFGIGTHFGTLAPGQDADLVIWDADPLEPTSTAVTVLVRGQQVSLQTRQKTLADRYAPARRAEPWPPAYR